MNDERHTTGVVYSATTVHGADSSYQIALVDFEDGGRRLVRMEGPPVAIGDAVRQAPGSKLWHALRENINSDRAAKL